MSSEIFPLQREWRLLVFKDWKQQHVVSTWTSVRDFWSCMNHVPEPSTFRMPINFAAFHSDSAMTWEHPSNTRGGRWIISIDSNDTNNSVKLVDLAWLKTLMTCIGNCNHNNDIDNASAHNTITIHGVVINIRAAGHRINIWTNFDTDAANGHFDTLKAHGQCLRRYLGLPDRIKLEFKKHSDVETETYKAKSIIVV